MSNVDDDSVDVERRETNMEATASSRSPSLGDSTDRDRDTTTASSPSEVLSPRNWPNKRDDDGLPQPAAFDALLVSYNTVLADLNARMRLLKQYKRLSDRQKATIDDLLRGTAKDDIVARRFSDEVGAGATERLALMEQIEELKLKAGILESTNPGQFHLDTTMTTGMSEMSQSAAGVDGLLRAAHHEREVASALLEKLKAEFAEYRAESEKNIEALTNELDRAKILQKEMSKLLIERNKNIGELKADINDYKIQCEELKKSRLEGETEVGEEEKPVIEKTENETDVPQKSTDKTELLLMQDEIERLKEALAEAKEACQIAEERLGREHNLSEDHRKRASDLDENRRRLQAQIITLNRKLTDFEKRALTTSQSAENLERKLRVAMEEAKRLKIDLTKANRDRELLNRQLRSLEYSQVRRTDATTENELRLVAEQLHVILKQNNDLKAILHRQRDVIARLNKPEVVEATGGEILRPPPVTSLVDDVNENSIRSRTNSDRLPRQRKLVQLHDRPHSESDFSKLSNRLGGSRVVHGKLPPVPSPPRTRETYMNWETLDKDLKASAAKSKWKEKQ